jgi:outer membrane protein assembly factor BamB
MKHAAFWLCTALVVLPVHIVSATTYDWVTYCVPVVRGDTLILPARFTSELVAVDKASKNVLWTWTSAKRIVQTSPTLLGNVLYLWVNGDSSDACAIDFTTGRSVWKTTIPTTTLSREPAVVSGETVLFSLGLRWNSAYAIRAFDRTTGKALWSLSGYHLIDVNEGVITATTDDDTTLTLLAARTGQRLFQTTLSSQSFTDAFGCHTVDGKTLASVDGALIALDVRNRQLLWQIFTGQSAGIPVIEGNTIFIVTRKLTLEQAQKKLQNVEVRSMIDGKLINAVPVGIGQYEYSPSRAFVSSHELIVVSGGSLVGIDRTTLREKWRLGTAGTDQIERVEQTVFVGKCGPYLFEVDPRVGEIIWHYGSVK